MTVRQINPPKGKEDDVHSQSQSPVILPNIARCKTDDYRYSRDDSKPSRSRFDCSDDYQRFDSFNASVHPNADQNSYNYQNNKWPYIQHQQDFNGLMITDKDMESAYPMECGQRLEMTLNNIFDCNRNGQFDECHRVCNELQRIFILYDKEFYHTFPMDVKTKMAHAAFILGMYVCMNACVLYVVCICVCLYKASTYLKRERSDISYKYMEQSLKKFRDCNICASEAGFIPQLTDYPQFSPSDTENNPSVVHVDNHSSANNNIDNIVGRNIDQADLGYFWAQICEVYILGGNILNENKQPIDAEHMYRFAYNLAASIKHKKIFVTTNALENLAIVNMHLKRVSTAIYFTQIVINLLEIDCQRLLDLRLKIVIVHVKQEIVGSESKESKSELKEFGSGSSISSTSSSSSSDNVEIAVKKRRRGRPKGSKNKKKSKKKDDESGLHEMQGLKFNEFDNCYMDNEEDTYEKIDKKLEMIFSKFCNARAYLANCLTLLKNKQKNEGIKHA